jgi:carboxypeptidase-like protein/TonB-dependent receptor-like protein
MSRKILFIFFTLFITGNLIAQEYTLSGVITDSENGDPLIGANVQIGASGVVTDFDGNFAIKLSNGKYQVSFSYVGYDTQIIGVEINGADQVLNVSLGTGIFLEQITVVADIAKERETPVAFSNIPTKKLDEELASQDLPMILNSTPGAYATQSGGGDGDARITIRGFNQRNVAVMLDGIPVNDMENGWVYWSNWFGLDLVTKTMQVQRGLGASKLAIPSVGGTINILTKGIEAKRGVRIRQEVGNNAYVRTTIGLTSGRLKNGWGVSAAGSYKTGDGWADQNFTKGYFYYLRVDKEIGKHLFSLSGFGAPQSHGQRSFQSPIATFDADFAKEQGIPQDVIDETVILDKGLRFNEHWGNLNGEKLNTRKNYYHKPQFSLRHSYNGSDKFFLSNVVYLSVGNGGGTGVFGSFDADSTGQLDLTKAYEANIFTSPIFKPEANSENIIRASVNNHFWYGLLSTARYTINKQFTLSGGVDLRDYRGEHYRSVYNLLGGEFFLGERNSRIDEKNTKLLEGDKFFYYDEGFVRWGGLFGLLEYKNERVSAFVNLSAAMTGYKAVDYMAPKQLDLDGETYFISYQHPFESNGVLYTVDNPAQEDIDYATDNGLTLDTKSAQDQLVDWIWIPNITFKTGASYKIDKQNSVFVNTGYLSKATRYNNVINSSYTTITRPDIPNGFAGGRLKEFDNYKNEEIIAFELGYSFESSSFSANVNGYYTKWNNKPLEFAPTVPLDPSDPESERVPVNINGLAAIHKGIEIDFAYKPIEQLSIEGLASIADWIWNSSAETTLEDGSTYEFDAKGVHVGDAAQLQYGGLVRYEPMKGLYFKIKSTYFANNYSNFEPESLKGDNARRESWKMPNYNIVDFHAGYNFKIKKNRFGLRFNVLNALGTHYISDAQNNDQFTQSFNDYDAKSASVFFGQGRRWTMSFEASF